MKTELEEAANRVSQLGEYDKSFESTRKNYFIKGAKWQQERMYSEKQMDDAYDKGFKDKSERSYSEEEVLELLHKRMIHTLGDNYEEYTSIKWFEQNKKQIK